MFINSFQNLFPCVSVSFESFRRRARWWFLFVRSFHIIADLSSAAVGEVMLKFDSTPSIAYPLSPNYSNPCILTPRIPDSCSSSWTVTKKLTTNTLSNGWLTHYPQANALSNQCMAQMARRTKSSRLKAGGPSRGPSGGLSGVRQEKYLSIEKSSQM